MRWFLLGSIGFCQQFLSMGARFQLSHAQLCSPTDRASNLVSFDRTQKSSLAAFFSWGWTSYFATGVEIGYGGAGQALYGIGINGDPYTARINLHYLRIGIGVQPQYAKERWGFWGSFSPSLAFLTQAELIYQGDSLPRGNLVAPQIIQYVVEYLNQSTDPNDRLVLLQMYRRSVPVLHIAGGMRVRLAPQVWLLGLLSYERSFGDIEQKGFRLKGEENYLYSPQRRPVQYRLLGLQLGIQYEVNLTEN
ncbi:MAG: hypothetical protein RMJ66_08285 [Bacteroidia bacterium]|nr:hypothetical protein [Bacteroidia bacterium]MDW8135045.1 hypothetical protein [Bacteroidia bacterium]